MDDDAPVIVTMRPATEHGWLRRPEMDTRGFDAWELPDGQMVAAQKGRTPRLATLSHRRPNL